MRARRLLSLFAFVGMLEAGRAWRPAKDPGDAERDDQLQLIGGGQGGRPVTVTITQHRQRRRSPSRSRRLQVRKLPTGHSIS